jgi:predicted ATPase/DNA-binding winged helix-turn-helix (wHTH) protein
MEQKPTPGDSHTVSRTALDTDVRSLATTPTRSPQGQSLCFGPFHLLVAQRLLLEGDRPVRLGSRALDILIALVERPGQLVTKHELMALVWPDTVVEEGNLKVHVAGLRRVLGDGRGGTRYLINVPGRGYRFVAPVVLADEPQRPAPYLATSNERHNLPAQLTRLIGRHEIIDSLIERLSIQRLLTIVGPGGIGKTAVALVIAERLIGAYEHGVWLIDLAPITDPHLVPTALAAALKLEIRSENPLPSLIVALRDKQMLLVLDNCEHVIDAAAALATGILKGSRGVQILATSREALRVEGERTYRLSGLESPPASGRLSAAEVFNFPATQLFVERAAAAANEFELNDGDAPSVAEICRDLDGIPLAIEFAAARVGAYSVQRIAALLQDRLRLLTGGHRTALPRHRTIKAALDWSYQLLDEEEKTLFRRLAIFVGGFTLEASGMVAGAEGAAPEIADRIASLVMKSLVVAETVGEHVRFRLLETTRAYALAMLQQSGEADTLSRSHAIYYRDLLEAASRTSARGGLSSAVAPEIDNIRAALTWTLAPEGDGSIGVVLAAASASIWLEMSLLAECRAWMGKALDNLDTADRGTRREMVLQTALGLSLMFTEGMSGRTHAALSRARELAEGVGDPDYELRTITGLAGFCHRREDFQGALALGRRAEAIVQADADPVNVCTSEWLLAASLFFLGENAEALIYARRAQQRQTTPELQRAYIARSGISHYVQAGCVVAQALWTQGLQDQSAKAVREVLADAQAGAHPLSLCMALNWCGCMLQLRLGDLEAAERCIAWLKDEAERQASSAFLANSLGFAGHLSAARGDLSVAERQLRASLDSLRLARSDLHYTPFLSGLALVMAMMGRIDESHAAADEALQRAERANAYWWMPEALRIKGEVQLSSDTPDAAEVYLCRSLDLARRQGALSWELRTSMSLGRLRHAQGRTREGRELLSAVYARFSEGFDTVDLRCARRHLDEWT